MSPKFLEALYALKDLAIVTDIRGYGMIGGIDLALVSEHFFREDLATDLVRRRAAAKAAPLIVLAGTAVHGASGARAANVAIYGVDDRFAQLLQHR